MLKVLSLANEKNWKEGQNSRAVMKEVSVSPLVAMPFSNPILALSARINFLQKGSDEA